MEYVLIVLTIVIILVILTWIGLRIKPKPFPHYHMQTPHLETVALPANLPAPVTRSYQQIYGNQVPVITSAAISGKAKCVWVVSPSLAAFVSPTKPGRTTATTLKQPS